MLQPHIIDKSIQKVIYIQPLAAEYVFKEYDLKKKPVGNLDNYYARDRDEQKVLDIYRQMETDIVFAQAIPG